MINKTQFGYVIPYPLLVKTLGWLIGATGVGLGVKNAMRDNNYSGPNVKDKINDVKYQIKDFFSGPQYFNYGSPTETAYRMNVQSGQLIEPDVLRINTIPLNSTLGASILRTNSTPSDTTNVNNSTSSDTTNNTSAPKPPIKDPWWKKMFPKKPGEKTTKFIKKAAIAAPWLYVVGDLADWKIPGVMLKRTAEKEKSKAIQEYTDSIKKLKEEANRYEELYNQQVNRNDEILMGM